MIPRRPWGGLSEPSGLAPGDAAILGVPFDGGACWRPGAAQAPRRLRELSDTSPAISEEGHIIQPEAFRVYDAGDVEPEAGEPRGEYFARIELNARALLQSSGFLLSIGGDHSVSIPLVQAFGGMATTPFGVVLLDAHPDLFDSYDGSTLSNACPMRRALESGLRPEHLLILGTRSYNPEELAFMRAKRIRFLPARAIARSGVDAVVALARERMAGLSRVYLTVDIDVADPGFAPGTGSPVAGGLSSRELLELVRGLLDSLPVKAMDLVEVAPPLDPTDATLFLALQVIFESFAVVARKQGKLVTG
jgi:agmatinase